MIRLTDDGAARRRRERGGRWAETLVAGRYLLFGWRLLDQRARLPAGEIDLILRRGRVLAFVEVKRRESLDAAAAALSAEQQRRIAAAAAQWLARRPNLAHLRVRFDAALVAPWRLPRLIADAWRRETECR